MPQTLRLEFAKSNTKVQKPKQLIPQQQVAQHQQQAAAAALASAQHQNAVAQLHNQAQLIPINRKLYFSSSFFLILYKRERRMILKREFSNYNLNNRDSRI